LWNVWWQRSLFSSSEPKGWLSFSLLFGIHHLLSFYILIFSRITGSNGIKCETPWMILFKIYLATLSHIKDGHWKSLKIFFRTTGLNDTKFGPNSSLWFPLPFLLSKRATIGWLCKFYAFPNYLKFLNYHSRVVPLSWWSSSRIVSNGLVLHLRTQCLLIGWNLEIFEMTRYWWYLKKYCELVFVPYKFLLVELDPDLS